nr:hypothetical protein GCM10020093_048850 [Planobispora longispora]
MIAETGTLVVLESEGNGRMCLTLPRTLISVVGIEKLLPAWRDLEVFLQLLPRSSTGERMNPYTSTWTGAVEGQEFHLVLLDNGRTAVLADEVGRQALRCIRCSACLNVCPVYERAGGHAYGSVYPGPIGAILTPQLRASGTVASRDRLPPSATGDLDASLPYASSLCGACFEVCPVAIDIPEVLVHLRARTPHPRAERLGMRAAGWVFDRPVRLARAQRLGGGCAASCPGACPARCPPGPTRATSPTSPPSPSATGGTGPKEAPDELPRACRRGSHRECAGRHRECAGRHRECAGGTDDQLA